VNRKILDLIFVTICILAELLMILSFNLKFLSFYLAKQSVASDFEEASTFST
jgi:hypothetical protein